MAFLELLDIKKIRKGLIYLLCVIVSIGLQNLLFARVSFWGVHVMFVPVIVVAIGIFEGGVWGAVFGLICGWLLDMTMLSSTATFLVLFALLGFGAGFLTEFVINRRFFSAMLLSLLALGITAACQIVPLWAFHSTPLGDVLPTAGLQTAVSLPFAVPAYFAVKAISARRKEF